MSDEGVEEIVESLLRQGLVAASQLAEQLARARSQSLRKAEQQGERAVLEARRIMVGERAMMRALILPATADRWWLTAKPEQIVQAHLMAQAWKDHDPDALLASEMISREIKARYGIGTADVGDDVHYLRDRMDVQQMTEQQMTLQQQRVAREHAEAMALVAAAQRLELSRVATELREQLRAQRVPEEYVANPDLVEALRGLKDATAEQEVLAAERMVAERMHLIEQDGIQGPDLGQLREEIGLHLTGVGDESWVDAEFVAAARGWHEARMLVRDGFVEQDPAGDETRYRVAEKELLARVDSLHREGESRYAGQGPADGVSPEHPRPENSVGTAGPVYGSAEHYERFAASLRGSASGDEIKGRVAAARSQGKHPSEAVTGMTPAPLVRKAAAWVGLGRNREQEGPTR